MKVIYKHTYKEIGTDNTFSAHGKSASDHAEVKKTIETFLPIFPGFYSTIFDEGDSFIEYELDGETIAFHYPELKEIPYDFIRSEFWDCIDYQSANLAVAQAVTDGVGSLLSDYVESITFQALKSPKEYNFYNDSVNVEIVPKTEAIAGHIAENWKAFSGYIRARYTSRDGFMSSYSNDPEDWREDSANFTDLSANGHVLGSILGFIAANEGIDEMALYYASNASEAFHNGATVDTSRLVAKWEGRKEDAE